MALGVIGSYGEIVFEVSMDRVRTFDNFTRSGSGRWENHDIISLKPMPEFIGPGQEDISFSIRLDAAMGLNPENELQKLRDMRDTGEVAQLIIGSKPVTNNLWLLESLQEQQRVFDNKGRLILADVELSLKEYPVLSAEGWVV